MGFERTLAPSKCAHPPSAFRGPKIDIICEMKLLATILTLPMAALAVTVEPLPQSEFADTEVSTNIAFAVDRAMMTRIEFTVALGATPTNNVEVAIGADTDGDGNLSVEESAYTFGYDCGKWFVRDKSKSGVQVEEWNFAHHSSTSTSDFDLSSRTFILKMRKLDAAWDLVKVTRRGCGAVCELVKAEGRKPGLVLEVR